MLTNNRTTIECFINCIWFLPDRCKYTMCMHQIPTSVQQQLNFKTVLTLKSHLIVWLFGSMVTLLLSDIELLGSIPGCSAWDFSVVENYSMLCTDQVFLCFSVLCPRSVLHFLQRRPCTEDPPVVSVFLHVVHRNLPLIGISHIEGT